MLKRTTLALLLAISTATPSAGQSWHEPARGTTDRADLMDAIRPHAEYMLGQAVKFRVDTLRVAGDRAFAVLQPLDAGGAEVRLEGAPMLARSGDAADFYDGSRIDVLYIKSGRVWVALHWAIGATDVWYSDPDLCAGFAPVLTDFCF